MVKIRGLLMIVPSGRFSIRKKDPFHFEWFLWKSHVRTIFYHHTIPNAIKKPVQKAASSLIIKERIPGKREKRMFCMNCGRELKEGTKFCSSCGARVEEEAPNQGIEAQKMPTEGTASAGQAYHGDPTAAYPPVPFPCEGSTDSEPDPLPKGAPPPYVPILEPTGEKVKKGNSKGLIIGLVIGGVVLLAAVAVLVWFLLSQGQGGANPQGDAPSSWETGENSGGFLTPGGSSSENSQPGTQENVLQADGALAGTVLMDTEELYVEVLGEEPNSSWGYGLNVKIVNRSERNLVVSLEQGNLNGCQVMTLFATQVAPGETVTDSIEWMSEDIKKYGITEITRISLKMEAYNPDDWMEDWIEGEWIDLYPKGKEADQPYIRTPGPGDQVLADVDGVTMTATGSDPESLFGFELLVFLENHTDKEWMISIDEVYVNGVEIDPYWATVLTQQTCHSTSICWDEDDLEEAGIADVEEIRFLLTIYDRNDWGADPIFNQTVEVHF